MERINYNRLKQSESRKIIIAGMSLGIEAYLDLTGEYLAGKSTSIVIGEEDLLKIIIAILNSKMADFYINRFFYSLKMAGGYLNIGTEILSNFPIPKLQNQIMFEELVGNCQNSDDFSYQLKLDLMVYKLYTLTYDECKIVDSEIEKLISRKDYDRMSIEELAKYEIRD